MDASLDGAFRNEIGWCYSSPEENEMIFDECILRKCKEPKEILWTAGFYEWSLSKPAGMKEQSCLFCTAHTTLMLCFCVRGKQEILNLMCFWYDLECWKQLTRRRFSFHWQN